MANACKLLIGDDQKLFSNGIVCLLREFQNFEIDVVGEVSDYTALLHQAKRHRPDLIICEIRLFRKDSIDNLGHLKNLFPNMRLIILSMYDDYRLIKNSFKQGVDGYILKYSSKDDLFQGLSVVMDGEIYMGEGVSISPECGINKKNGKHWDEEDDYLLQHNLTPREMEVLTEIARAKNNKEIAEELYISDQTVSVHRKNIMRKLKVSNTPGLIRIAYSKGII